MPQTSEAHFSKNNLKDIPQADHANFVLVTAQDDAQALAAALHAAQGHLEPQILLEKKRGLHVLHHGMIRVEVGPKQESAQADQADDSLLFITRFPDRQARDLPLATSPQGLADGCLGGDARSVR